MEQRLRAAMAAIKGVKIPDLPKEVFELQQALQCKFPNNQDIANIISANTKLSGEVLRIVNSPIMKLKRQVNSIREAVDSLGYANLKNLVLAAALKNIFNTREVLEIIEHSKDVAFCCAELSEYVDGVSRDEAYLIGLFHNGGALLLATKEPETYPKFFSLTNSSPISGVHKEIEKYGTSHMDIGILLGQRWKLPVEMLNVIMHHHTERNDMGQEKIRGMMAMVKISNMIVNEISLGSYITEEAKSYLKNAQQELLLDPETINQIRRILISSL